MRFGNVDGKGTVYDAMGEPVFHQDESVLRLVENDSLDVSEGSGVWNMKTLFGYTAQKGRLYVTDRRLLFLQRPDPFLAAKHDAYPVGMADAIAKAYKAQALKKTHALEFCEIEYLDVEGFWVKRRTYGVLFLSSPLGITRKAIMYQRGPQDDKFAVLKRLLEPNLRETRPENRGGSFVLGKKSPFARRRKQ